MAVNKTINKRTNTHGAMRNCIEYVLRQDKTGELLTYVTGPYCHDEINYDLVYRTFLEEKKMWNKDSGRMYAHNIISWHKDEQITLEQAFEFGKEFAEKWFSGFQTLVAVHKDKEHIHCHLVTNSVSYEDGRKLHNTRNDLERMKQLTNQMCRERGLTVAEKGKHFDGSQIEKGEVIAWSKDKYNLFRQQVKESFVADCAMAVLKALENCISKEKFIEKMKQFGWNVNWTEKRKHITFQNQDGKKCVTAICLKHFIWISVRRDWRMNLMEIGKNPELQPTETAEQPKNSETITESLTQPSQTPEESPIKLKVERDILVQSFEKAKEFMRTQKKQIQTLEEEKRMILSDRQKLREEVRKSTVEIQRLTTELSETQKLNQSLQQSNDDLRNRNGLKSRKEQEQLEEEIKDVRDQNSKLQIQVNKSSVEAVDEAQKKQKEAEKKMEQAETKARNEKKRAEMEIRKAKKEVKVRTEKMRDTEYFWGMGYITVILFVIIQNGAFQNDFIDFFRTPFMWYFQFCEWLAHPTYDNGFNQKIAYTCGEAWVIRILAIVAVLLIVVIIMAIIMEIIKIYKKMWDKISQMFLIGSLSGIAVLGDVIREYLPVNLILTFGFINVGIMLLKMYFQKKFEEKSLYADNYYD